MIDDVRRKFGLQEKVENKDEKESKEAEVTVPTRHKMLKAMETLGKGPHYFNVDVWSCCRNLIVLRSTQPIE